MSLFDDVQAMGRFESAKVAELKTNFSVLEKKYKSALSTIQALCSQIENLKKSLYDTEESARSEKQRLERECAETRSAFATVSRELKRTKCQRAAVTGNRDFWKREFDAMAMLYKLETEESEKLRRLAKVPELKATPVQGVFQFEPAPAVKIAAAIGK